MRADAEAGLVTCVNAFLVGRARIARRTVLRANETIVALAEEGRRAAASVTVEADEIAGTVVRETALDHRQAHLVRIAFISVQCIYIDLEKR